MKCIALKKQTQILIPKVWLANNFCNRFLGLMGKKRMAAEEGIFFPRCNSIHTFFMRFDIDVVFVSQEGKVLRVIEKLKPWKLLFPIAGVAHTLELAGGAAKKVGIQEGDSLQWSEEAISQTE